MSYDIYLEMDAGGPEPMYVEVGNMTSNVSPIWTKALYGKHLRDFHGCIARECVGELDFALEHMKMYPGRFDGMEPANGWGSIEGARDYLQRLRDMCLRYPLASIRISR